MRGHGAHLWMCGAMVAGAVIALLLTASPLAVLPVIGCVLAMVVMMRMAEGTGGHEREGHGEVQDHRAVRGRHL